MADCVTPEIQRITSKILRFGKKNEDFVYSDGKIHLVLDGHGGHSVSHDGARLGVALQGIDQSLEDHAFIAEVIRIVEEFSHMHDAGRAGSTLTGFITFEDGRICTINCGDSTTVMRVKTPQEDSSYVVTMNHTLDEEPIREAFEGPTMVCPIPAVNMYAKVGEGIQATGLDFPAGFKQDHVPSTLRPKHQIAMTKGLGHGRVGMPCTPDVQIHRFSPGTEVSILSYSDGVRDVMPESGDETPYVIQTLGSGVATDCQSYPGTTGQKETFDYLFDIFDTERARGQNPCVTICSKAKTIWDTLYGRGNGDDISCISHKFTVPEPEVDLEEMRQIIIQAFSGTRPATTPECPYTIAESSMPHPDPEIWDWDHSIYDNAIRGLKTRAKQKLYKPKMNEQGWVGRERVRTLASHRIERCTRL